ncbi:MAG: energy transducer TonB [Gammaproteobacteria bacterium]|nr:energy transducer TonB [Gammaproteobacteria bacterium]
MTVENLENDQGGYRKSRSGKFWMLLRLGISAIFATAGVLTLLVVGVSYYQPDFEDPVSASLRHVDVVDVSRDPELLESLRSEGLEVPVRRAPEPPPLPERQISGFVQLSYTVNPDGTVSDVRVLGAVPRGVYENEATAQVSRQMRAPSYENGVAVAREVTEVVEFTVPASDLTN